MLTRTGHSEPNKERRSSRQKCGEDGVDEMDEVDGESSEARKVEDGGWKTEDKKGKIP